MNYKCFLLFYYVFIFSLSAKSQNNFIAGKSYFSESDYVEYIVGNSPFIISVPHGGSLKPSEIPDRNCTNCTYVMDTNTQELGRAIGEAVFRQWGCYPHIIVNRLHRIKLDANRDKPEAADGNFLAEKAWEAYQNYVDAAKSEVNKNYGKGIFLDLHGHGHTIQRLELGYLLTANELEKSDLNTQKIINYSSFKSLATNNLQKTKHNDLLRGDFAIGTLLSQKGFPAIPSKQDPYPAAADPYFNGGFNTLRNGSMDEGTMDALQIETNYTGVRDNATNRKRFGDSLATTMKIFFQKYYFPNFPFCTNTALQEKTVIEKNIRPNPFCDHIDLPFEPTMRLSYHLFDLQGKLVSSGYTLTKSIQLTDNLALESYLLRVNENDVEIFSQIIMHKCL
jgi:N-formylglutamate amidohydrolase